MSKIEADNYMVTYDEEVGAIYCPRKGIIKTTTSEHACAIEDCLTKYFNNQMSGDDKTAFENYMEDAFGNGKDLPIEKYFDLRERDVLRRVELVIANECNLRCKYCYAHGGTYDREAQRLLPEDARKYLQNLIIGKYRYVEIITFFGGEPTLCPETIQATCEFFEENVKKGLIEKMPLFLMVSNGTLIDENMALLIHKYDIRVTISIDGPQEINDLLRVDMVGNGTYSKIVSGIENLNRVGSSPLMLEATYTTKHKEMGYTKEEIHEYLKKKFNVKKVVVADCCSGGIEANLDYTDWDTHIDNDGEALYADIGHTYSCITQNVFATMGCDAGFGTVILMPNGDLYPCHFFVNREEYQIANYHDDGFDFSNYDKVLDKFASIQKLRNPRCADCWAKTVCLSCPAQLLLEKDENSIQADCHTRRIMEKHLILKCVKASLLKNDVTAHIQ